MVKGKVRLTGHSVVDVDVDVVVEGWREDKSDEKCWLIECKVSSRQRKKKFGFFSLYNVHTQ